MDSPRQYPFFMGPYGTARTRTLRGQLVSMLEAVEVQGGDRLVATVRAILTGRRDRSVLIGQDDKERVIAQAILAGIENPANLPPLVAQSEPITAASGQAAMVSAADRGDVQSLSVLANMAEQTVRVGDDMGRLGRIMCRLVGGERDADLLCQGMGPMGRGLVLDIIDELAWLGSH